MARLTPGHTVCGKLVDILGLQGQSVTAVTVRFAVRDVVTAVIERHLDEKEVEGVVKLLEEDGVEPLIVFKDI